MQNTTQDQELTAARIAIAALEVQSAHMAAQMLEVKASLVAVTAKLDAMNTTLTEARGGWRTLMMVGGAAGSLGAFGSWIAQHLKP